MTFGKWKTRMDENGWLVLTTHRKSRTYPWKSKCKFAKKYWNLVTTCYGDDDKDCKLTFDEYLFLCYTANITHPDMIGIHRGKLQLGRIGDTGDYTLDNCRFITVEQNVSERDKNGGNKQISLKQTGKLNPSFKGYTITPNGKFESSRLAAKHHGCGESTILRRINNPSMVGWYRSDE